MQRYPELGTTLWAKKSSSTSKKHKTYSNSKRTLSSTVHIIGVGHTVQTYHDEAGKERVHVMRGLCHSPQWQPQETLQGTTE
eukprot:69926-Amphidinium_carterae.1